MKKSFILLFSLFSLPALAQMNQGELITKNAYLEIPAANTRDEFHVKGSLRNDEYDFMMDSGAPAFISSEIQKKYNFKYLMRGSAKDAGGKKVRTDIVMIDTIRVGTLVFTNIPALVFDLKNSPLECFGFAGNVGSNMLRHLIVQFDMRKNNITLTNNEQLLHQHLSGPKPLRIDGQSDAFLPVTMDNDITDTIHFDSGDGQLYEISKRKADIYAAKHSKNIVRKGYGTLSMGIGGVDASFQQYIFKPSAIDIADQKISGGTISIAGNDKSRMGRELLNYGILQLNYIDSTFIFQPYTDPYKADSYDYGFKVIPDDDDVLASCVWENSDAAQQGMKSGDYILRLNNLDFTKLSKCDMEKSLRAELQQNAPSITVTFRHKKQKPQTITLQKTAL